MQTKNGHLSEHITYPAHKMIGQQPLRDKWLECVGGRIKASPVTKGQRRMMKKIHTRRSRRFLKEQLRNEDV